MEKNLNADFFWELGLHTIQELETEQGILASSREEIYGCIFGRDSLITSLEILKAYEQVSEPYFLTLVKKVLINLALLQGKESNMESGEEPGKCIHEYRPDNHERLTKSEKRPWFVYADNSMKNYDSVDATPLFLIAIYRYYQASRDELFLNQMMPSIESALNWVLIFGDSNGDGFVDYRFDPVRKFGGLVSQSWMDSEGVLFHENGERAVYPIAPVEVQGYVYLALKLWAAHFSRVGDNEKAEQLQSRAHGLKKLFNEKFLIEDEGGLSLAAAIDGAGKQIASPRSSMGHLLWASTSKSLDQTLDCILYEKQIPLLVKRLMMPDIFEPAVGLRTLSEKSKHFDPGSYHNGSIWPHDNNLIAEGFENFGFIEEAKKVRRGMLRAVEHFETPLELFVYDKGYANYKSEHSGACKKQAWSAASLLPVALSFKNESIQE